MANSAEITNLEQVTKAITGSDKALQSLAGTYLTLVKNMGDATEKVKTHTATIDGLAKAQKEAANAQKLLDAANKQLTDSEAKLKTFDAQMYEQILKNNKALADQKKAIQDKVKASDAEAGSLVRMRQELSTLTAAYDKAGSRTKANADQINNLSREIGKAEAATNRHQRGVGGYADQLGKFKNIISELPGPLGSAMGAAEGLVTKLSAFGPVGLWVGGSILSIGAPLAAFFLKSEEGVEMLERKFAGFKASLNVLVGELISSGQKMAAPFDDPNKKMQVFWTLLLHGINPAWTDLGVKMDTAAVIAEKYTAKLQEMEKAEIKLIVPRSEANLKIKEARLLYADSSKSLEERIDGLKTALKLENETADKEVIHQKNVVDNLREINKLKESSGQLRNEDDKKLAEAIAKENELRTESAGRQIRTSKSLQTGQKEILAEEKAATEKALKDKLDAVELAYTKAKEVINQVHIDGITSEKQYQDQLINQEITFLNKKLSLYKSGTKEYEDIELAIQNVKLKSQDDKNKEIEKGLKTEYDINTAYYDKIKKSRENLIKQSIDDEEAMYEYERELSKKAAEKKIEDEKKTAEKIKDIQFQMASEAVNGIFDLGSAKRDEELSALDKERQKKLSNEKLTAAQKEKINEEYDKKAAAIKTKQAKADKLQAEFNIIINTAKDVVASLLTPALIPWIIAMGALELGIVQAQKIPTFKDGVEFAPERGIFGEAGRELAFLRSGEVLLADKPTYFEGSKFKGANIKSNAITEQIINLSEHMAGGRQMTDDRILKGLSNVEHAIMSKPVMIFDKENRVIGQATTNSQTIYLNRLMRNN
ncbi:MAG TPA: hypothetical protein VIK55_06685 [Paludibacter sp.]